MHICNIMAPKNQEEGAEVGGVAQLQLCLCRLYSTEPFWSFQPLRPPPIAGTQKAFPRQHHLRRTAHYLHKPDLSSPADKVFFLY